MKTKFFRPYIFLCFLFIVIFFAKSYILQALTTDEAINETITKMEELGYKNDADRIKQLKNSGNIKTDKKRKGIMRLVIFLKKR